MNIIKPGEIPKEKIRFWCSYCGCIFEADIGEYETEAQFDPVYSCRCPTCERMCVASDKSETRRRHKCRTGNGKS